MKIFFVIDSLGSGGAEHSVAAMIPELTGLGHQTSIVALYVPDEGAAVLAEANDFVPRLLPAGGVIRRARALRRLIKEENPDIVHTSLFSANMVGRLGSLGLRSKLVCSLVSTPYVRERFAEGGPRPWKFRIVQFLDCVTGWFAVDQFHAVSEGVAEVNSRHLLIRKSKISVVQRGRSRDRLGVWSFERRTTVRERVGVDLHRPLLLAVGRQERVKAHVDLVLSRMWTASRGFSGMTRTP